MSVSPSALSALRKNLEFMRTEKPESTRMDLQLAALELKPEDINRLTSSQQKNS